MNTASTANTNLIFSYLELRKAVGVLGTAFPFLLVLGGCVVFKIGVQGSISSYYHTGMGDVFVGVLWAIGFFLLSYKGYEKQDSWAGNIACVAAIGVSLFPTDPANPTPQQVLIGNVHLAFAALFFLTLTFFCLFLFTKSDKDKKTWTARKKTRNNVYKTCGAVMLICLALIVVDRFLPEPQKTEIGKYNPVFWLESFAVIAFGISWLTKGEAILKDQN